MGIGIALTSDHDLHHPLSFPIPVNPPILTVISALFVLSVISALFVLSVISVIIIIIVLVILSLINLYHLCLLIYPSEVLYSTTFD